MFFMKVSDNKFYYAFVHYKYNTDSEGEKIGEW